MAGEEWGVPGETSPALADERRAADAEALGECLERRLPEIRAIRRAASRAATSYTCEVVTVELAGGKERKIFLKDFGVSRLPKDDLLLQRERELQVYRELLDGGNLGSAEFYGAVWDEPKNRFWLLLEFVDARELRYCEFGDWVSAARWLGRLQGYFQRRSELLRECDFLLRHDAQFFWGKARLALQSTREFSSSLAERLQKVLQGYDRVVEVMTRQPQTLVHGSYRPQNILVSGTSGPVRVFPIDWELAALGAPLYDLAFLCDGFRPPKLGILGDAYRQEASQRGMSVPEREEMSSVLDCFRLHKVLKSLGDSVRLAFPESTVVKLVGRAEEMGRALGL